ncbi:MAG TPA: serine protease [Planctomycetaceae bacterium]|jgi:S1-C subfamily serine protease
MGQLRHSALTCGVLFSLAVVARADDSLPATTVQRLKDATVYVKTAIGPLKMTGSGFVIQVTGDSALIATNQHVIGKPKELRIGGFIPGLRGRDKMYLRSLQQGLAGKEPAVTVVFHSGDTNEQSLNAEVLGGLDEPDLAILKVSGIKISPKPIEFANSPAPLETMPIFVLGFPFGDALSTNHGSPAITVGKGTVSSIRKDASGKTAKIQIDGALNPGNSGGPVVDSKGNLIGISVQTIQGSNIGLAIPPGELVATLEGRVGKPVVSAGQVVNGAAPTYEVVIPVIDPMKKLKSATLQFVDGAVPLDASKSSEPQLNAAAGNQKVDLTISDRVARATLALPVVANQKMREITVQASYVNQNGETTYLEPMVLKVAAPAVVTAKVDGNSATITQTQKSGNRTIRREVTITRGNSSGKSKFDDLDEDAGAEGDDEKSSKKATAKKGSSNVKKTTKSGKEENDGGSDKTTEVAWTNKITKMKKIPDEEITGRIDGLEFTLDRAELKTGSLTFRKGTAFFADLELAIVLWTKRDEDVSGRKFVINGQPRAGEPVVRFSAKRKGEKLPKTQHASEYLMVLEFGDYNAELRMQPGKIYICLPDRGKSFLAGSFEAQVD